MLVLLVLALLLAMVAPSLRGWSRGTRLTDAGNEFLAAAHWARSQAIATATVHRLQVDQSQGAYMVSALEGEQFIPAGAEFGRWAHLPEGVRIRMSRGDGSVASAIEFHTNGRVTPARVILEADWGQTVELAAATPAEPLRRVAAGADR